MTALSLDDLFHEYTLARGYSEMLAGGLTDEQIAWRPDDNASGIGWHLGHQAAVNHFMVRNLTAAEPSHNPAFDALFDSATVEADRGALPPIEAILDYRSEVAATTERVIELIIGGEVGAPRQLTRIAEGLLRAVINHEYQHDAWVLEVRGTIGEPLDPPAPSPRVESVEGYWMLS